LESTRFSTCLRIPRSRFSHFLAFYDPGFRASLFLSRRKLSAFSAAMTRVLSVKNAGNARYVSAGQSIIHSNVSRELILSLFCIPSNYHRNDAYGVAACRMQTPTTSLSCTCATIVVSGVCVCANILTFSYIILYNNSMSGVSIADNRFQSRYCYSNRGTRIFTDNRLSVTDNSIQTSNNNATIVKRFQQ